jgi:hypothetical protein
MLKVMMDPVSRYLKRRNRVQIEQAIYVLSHAYSNRRSIQSTGTSM